VLRRRCVAEDEGRGRGWRRKWRIAREVRDGGVECTYMLGMNEEPESKTT
jgi:hypothetical protein